MSLAVIGIMAIFAFSLYGWGRAFRRSSGMNGGGHWIVTITVGLAAIIFLGGILNLGRLATLPSLGFIVIAGALLSCILIRQDHSSLAAMAADWRRQIVADRWTSLAVYGVIAVILIFTIETQLSPAAYNIHDDFEKYFAYPVRMVQTGTVFGSPLSAIGAQALGGEAFLQGFVIALFPITYINGVDAVFGLLLCMALASQCAGGGRGVLAVTLASILGVALIDPQYVNISALFLPAAMIMGLIALSADIRELKHDIALPNAAAMGLLYAASIALKTTFVVFAIVHLSLATICVVLFQKNIRKGFTWGFRTSLYVGLFLAPWILLHAENYYAGLTIANIKSALQSDPVPSFLDLFSPAPLFYGPAMAHYTGLVAAAVLAAMLATCAALKSVSEKIRLSSWMTVVAAMSGIASYLVCIFVLAPQLAGVSTALRYFTPFAIGIVPAVIGLSAFHTKRSGNVRPTFLKIALPLTLALVPVLAFLPSLNRRIDQAVQAGSILAFYGHVEPASYLKYNQEVLQGSVRDKVMAAQSAVPAGETVVAWINASFYLNYTRNRVLDLEPGGFATPWFIVPTARYIIWEYEGFAVRTREEYIVQSRRKVGAQERVIGTRALQFLDSLYAAKADMVYNDGHIAVLHLADPVPNR